MHTPSRDKVLIVGGGTAGVPVAARLARQIPARDITILEPSAQHHVGRGRALAIGYLKVAKRLDFGWPQTFPEAGPSTTSLVPPKSKNDDPES